MCALVILRPAGARGHQCRRCRLFQNMSGRTAEERRDQMMVFPEQPLPVPGMAHNLVFHVLADRLAQREGEWQPFKRKRGCRTVVFPKPEARRPPCAS